MLHRTDSVFFPMMDKRENDALMIESLSNLPIELLYKKQQEIEERIELLRKDEPSKKRGREYEYKYWVDKIQDQLDMLHAVRDEIVNRKEPHVIYETPKNQYSPDAVRQILAVAKSYLDHADRLIYSYGSKTFLSGYELFDPAYNGRGNIDCSTFLLLVLSGITYETSPYSTGTVEGLTPALVSWAQTDLVDFSNLPKTYIDIAERIGRPYLRCPKGLDIEKAAAMGISIETLGEEIRRSGATRRSTTIAQHYIQNGAAFYDPDYLCPGDLVFYRSAEFFKDRSDAEAQIVHVGIAAKDTALMFNSSGYLNKERAAEENLAAVSIAPIFGRREPSFFARPAYK